MFFLIADFDGALQKYFIDNLGNVHDLCGGGVCVLKSPLDYYAWRKITLEAVVDEKSIPPKLRLKKSDFNTPRHINVVHSLIAN